MNFIAALRYIKTYLIQLNLFESPATYTDPTRLRIDIISTRLYVALLTISMFVLLLFTTMSQKTQTVTVRSPSQDIFEKLYSKYATTLQCPCEQVEILYKTLINISYEFHPVCSSVFVSNRWINLLFSPDMAYYYPLDFRSSASGQFQLLASLCLFANRTLQNAQNDFLSNNLLSPQVLSSVSLKSQIEASSEFLRTSTIYTFRRLLNMVRDTTRMNGLQPAMQTAKMHLLYVYPNDSIYAYPYETIWEGDYMGVCFCGVTSNCYAQSSFFDLYAEETAGALLYEHSLETVTGFLVGCYALDALLKSSLACFFNSTCLTTVLSYFPTNDITNIDILKIDQTLYPSETTVDTLASSLFIEHWSSETSFTAYYSKCAPTLCTYKFTQRNSFLQILTTLLGIYGGLTVVLRMCIPHAVQFLCGSKISKPSRNHQVTILQRLRNVQRPMKVWIIEFNLFKTATARTDLYELKTTRITTRIYLIVLLLALSIIIIYLLSSLRVHTETVQNPSRAIFKNLHDQYTSTLQCPCSHIVNSYELFTSLSPIFHPVCSSLFISEQWTVSISSSNAIDSEYAITDFRVAGPAFFNTLRTLCSLSRTTIADAWYIFGQSPVITDSVLGKSEFQARTKVAIEQFQNNTISEFERVLSLVDLHTKTMYTTGYENILLYTDQLATSITTIDFGWQPATLETCSCGLNDQCKDVMRFYCYTSLGTTSLFYLNFTLSDILVGCFVVSSVLQSSLGCFFNQTCLDMIQDEVKSDRSINISILDKNSTRFSPGGPIKTILNNMMVETWNAKIDYDNYYKQCAPEQCIYTYISQHNPLQIVTTIMGLFGGLSVALKIVIPLIVYQIRKRMRPREDLDNIPNRTLGIHRVATIWRAAKTKLLELNLFKSELAWDDNRRYRREIITTRLYLLLLFIAVIILVMYTFIDTQTTIVKVLRPSQEEFDHLRLHPQSSATLDCLCKDIVVPYQSFISIKPQYHQLCSSDFVAVNSTWISLLYSPTAGMEYAHDDYRLFAVPQFQLLSSLCTLANETVTEAIAQFSRNTLTNERVQSREIIELQADTILTRFRLSTPRTFVLTLDFIRHMNQGNGIVSSIFSNWHFVSLNFFYDEWAALWALPHSYGNDSCSCGTSSTCISQASFNGWMVPGFHVGCYPLESLLQSTLECLYNITCIDQLKCMHKDSNMIFNPLNDTLSSPNITVQSLVDNILVGSWETEVSYEQYYATCAPLWCTYTFDGQISPIYTVTTIIGLYGGLTVVLKLVAPVLVRIGHYIITHRHRRRQVGGVMVVVTIEQLDKS